MTTKEEGKRQETNISLRNETTTKGVTTLNDSCLAMEEEQEQG